jgi:hypothetical protein
MDVGARVRLRDAETMDDLGVGADVILFVTRSGSW